MLELLTDPPPPEAIAKMTAIEGVRIVPTMLTTQQGPDAAPRTRSGGRGAHHSRDLRR